MSPRRLAIYALVLLSVPALAHAAGFPTTIVPPDCNGMGGCQSICDIAQLAQNVLNAAIYIAVFLSAVLFAWAGWLYLTNVGNSSGVSRAKEVFVNVIIGLVIILGAWLLVDTIMKVFTGGHFGPWNSICLLWQHASSLLA